jgi:raffinose/stachyose/melibiose transport system substrate-binding protein
MTRIRQRLGARGLSLATVALSAAMLAGCGGDSASPNPSAPSGSSGALATGTFQVLSFFPQKNYNTWLRDQIATFESAHPGVKIEVQYTDPTNITQKLRTSVAGGTAPDVVTLFPGSATTSLWTAGKLLDFTPALKADPEWTTWTEGLSKVPPAEYTVDDHIFAVSVSSAPSMFWYWKSDLAKAGYTEFPTDTDGLIALSQALRAKGVQPIVMGLNSQALFNLTYLWWTLEANYDPAGVKGRLADEGKYSWTSDEFVQTADLLKKLYDANVFYDDALQKNYDPDQKVEFGQHKGAMSFPFGPWMDGYYPDSTVSQIGVALFPPIAGADPTVPGSTDMMFGIPTVTDSQKDAAHQRTMLAFVKQLGSPESEAALWAQGIFPIMASATTSPSPNPWASVLEAQIKAVADAAATTDSYTYSANTDQVLSNGLQALILGKTTTAKLLQDVQDANKKDHPCAPEC